MKFLKNLLSTILIVGITLTLFYSLDLNRLGNTVSQQLTDVKLEKNKYTASQSEIYHFGSVLSSPEALPQEPTVEQDEDYNFGHCYSNMNDRQRLYYRLILSGFEEMTDTFFEIAKGDANYKNNVNIAYNGVLNDNPEIFWHNNTYEIRVNEDSSCEIRLGFSMDKQERNQKQAELNKTVDAVIASTNALSSFEKEIYFYELLCERISYAPIDQNVEYTAYGALCEGIAVCEGYAKAMQLLCKRSGIECLTVRGVTSGNHHMWNLIKLSDEWYELDITLSDRPDSTPNYLYFNTTSEDISQSHNRLKDISDLPDGTDFSTLTYNFNLPIAEGTLYNRFVA